MPLQRPFRGLADHVGSYLGGNVPMELSGALLPTILAEDFVNPYEYVRTTGAITALGQGFVTPVVSAGELHRIRSLLVEGLNTGGTNALLPVVNPDTIGLVGLTDNTPSVFGPNNRWYIGVHFEQPLLLPAGGQIGWVAIAHSAGTLNLDLVVLRQRIRV